MDLDQHRRERAVIVVAHRNGGAAEIPLIAGIEVEADNIEAAVIPRELRNHAAD
jgi:hypothetical protein